jgi:hypothetical protein
MRIRRGLLFWGLFLIPLGAVPLLVRAGTVDAASLAGAWRLWPVILIAVGLALVAGRSQVALVGTVVTAIILGVAGGAALSTGNAWFGMLGVCTDREAGDASVERSGTFQSPAEVKLDLNCGNLDLTTGSGLDWSFQATYGSRPPGIEDGPDRLSVTSPRGGSDRHQRWEVRLPSDATRSIDLTGNAGSGTIALGGADVEKVRGTINAFDLTIEAGEASLGRLDLSVNAGRTRITLGHAAVTGDLSVNAGAIDLCVPDDVPLRIRMTDQLTFAQNLDDRGLVKSGDTWTRTGGNLNDSIELSVSGAAASFTLDPDGGCR